MNDKQGAESVFAVRSSAKVLQRMLSAAAVLFVLCLLVMPAAAEVSVWDKSTEDPVYVPDGGYYEIQNAAQLAGFASWINAGENAYATYVLTSHIDLGNHPWTPIGTSNYDKAPTDEDVKMFKGNFDGGNHIITNLTSKDYVPDSSETVSTEYSFGLFGYVYGANISNVKLANVNIDCGTRQNSDDDDVNGSGVAALIGYYHVADRKTCVIENCHVLSGTVKASNNMGGLIGHMDSQISQPEADITIRNCSNAADVTTEAREAGGILGLMNSAREGNYLVTMRGTITFKDCINTGDITSLGGGGAHPSAGGILGRDHNQAAGQRLKLIFDGCKNSGTITVTAYEETHAAGIAAGYYSNGAWLIAKNCNNTGNVVVNNPTGTVYAGELISYGGVVELIDSTSTGTVTGGIGNKYVGGAQNILFLEGMSNFGDTVKGYTYYLNGGKSPEYAALVDDAAGGGNFHLVETAHKLGFEFEGWYANAAFEGEKCTALNNNVKTYYAKWSAFSIDFKANGGTGDIDPQPVNIDSLPPNTFTRTGYTFKGWNNKSDGSGAGYADGQSTTDIPDLDKGIILYAQWKANTYSLTWSDGQGGSVLPEPEYVEYGACLPDAPDNPSRDGYTFTSWFVTPSTMPAEAVTVISLWKANTYNVSFNRNGGYGTMENMTLTYDTEPVPLTDNSFTRAGYTFTGWNSEEDGSGVGYADGASVQNLTTGNKGTYTLYAQWKANTTTITFENSTISCGSMNATYDSNELTAVSENPFSKPTKDGYTLLGWNTTVDGGVMVVDAEGSLVSNVAGYTNESGFWVNKSAELTLYAQWTPITYSVTFDSNGDSGTMGTMEDMALTYDAEPVSLTYNSFTRAGYTFTGWNNKSDGSGVGYADGALVQNLTTENKGTYTLYAQWKANTTTITFENSTIPCGSMNATYDSNALTAVTGSTSLSAPSWTGHTFKGWNTTDGVMVVDAEGELVPAVDGYTNESGFWVNESAELTLYAQWQINQYTITWIVDGAKTTETYDYGTNPSFKGSTDKASDAQYTYTFSGWSPEIGTVIGDVEYIAQYATTLNKYTVTWNVSGVETEETYDYGANPSFKGSTDKEADAQYTYTFIGWDKEIVSVTGDTEYTATYKATAIPDEPDYESDVKPETPTTPEEPADDITTIIGKPIDTADVPETIPETITEIIPEIIPEVPVEDNTLVFESSPIVAAVILENGDVEEAAVTFESTTVWPTPDYEPYEFELEIDDFTGDAAHIVLRVDLSALEEQGVLPDDLGVFHNQNGTWTLLDSVYTIKDGWVYYVAETPSFSPFKIDYVENGSTFIGEQENPDTPPADEPETPFPVLGILAGLGAAVALRRK